MTPTPPKNAPSPAVRAYLVTLSCEAGGNLPAYGMATIPGPRASTAVVPQVLAVPLWLGLRDMEATR